MRTLWLVIGISFLGSRAVWGSSKNLPTETVAGLAKGLWGADAAEALRALPWEDAWWTEGEDKFGQPGRLSRRKIGQPGRLFPDESKGIGPAEGAITLEVTEAPLPAVFVDGVLHDRWNHAGDRSELILEGVGLKHVRIEWESDATTFVAAFGQPVTIKVWSHSGSLVKNSARGPRCGRVLSRRARHGCHEIQGRKVGSVFPLELCALAHVIGTSGGSLIQFGGPLLATRPGLYTIDASGKVWFDSTYGGRKTPPLSCEDLRRLLYKKK